MKTREIKLKGLGIRQMELLVSMAMEGLIIKVVTLWGEPIERDIILSDKDSINDYTKLKVDFFSSLYARDLFVETKPYNATHLTIEHYTLKKEIKAQLLKS